MTEPLTPKQVDDIEKQCRNGYVDRENTRALIATVRALRKDNKSLEDDFNANVTETINLREEVEYANARVEVAMDLVLRMNKFIAERRNS